MAWQCARSQRISIESYVRRRLERRRQLITRPPQTQLVNLPCAILPEGPFYFPFHLSFFYERPRAPLPSTGSRPLHISYARHHGVIAENQSYKSVLLNKQTSRQN